MVEAKCYHKVDVEYLCVMSINSLFSTMVERLRYREFNYGFFSFLDFILMNQGWFKHWFEFSRLVGSFCSMAFIKSIPVYVIYLQSFFLLSLVCYTNTLS